MSEIKEVASYEVDGTNFHTREGAEAHLRRVKLFVWLSELDALSDVDGEDVQELADAMALVGHQAIPFFDFDGVRIQPPSKDANLLTALRELGEQTGMLPVDPEVQDAYISALSQARHWLEYAVNGGETERLLEGITGRKNKGNAAEDVRDGGAKVTESVDDLGI